MIVILHRVPCRRIHTLDVFSHFATLPIKLLFDSGFYDVGHHKAVLYCEVDQKNIHGFKSFFFNSF